MKNQRIKIFLGGYVNFLNAQNINCRALSENLNQDKFEIWTMLYWCQNAKDFQPQEGVHYLTCGKFVRIAGGGWIPYLVGLLRCDVAYLPKGEYNRFCKLVARVFGCKLFTTVEGILDAEILSRIKRPEKYIAKIRKFEPELYAITKFIAAKESVAYGFRFKPQILYLGTDVRKFMYRRIAPKQLSNIVFIGNDLIRKRATEFIRMAMKFPQIIFHIVGGNVMADRSLEDYLAQENITNVKYHGLLDHPSLAQMLQGMDLMYLPSRSEGFPKVMLEAACAGVPTLCYGDYGAQEWITNGKDGYVVNTFEEAIEIIQFLSDNPEKLQLLSDQAVKLGKRFDWKNLIRNWEEVITEIYKLK